MDAAGEQEKPNHQEIPLEPQTARALGNGLRQIFPDSSLMGISVNITSLREKLTAEQDKKDLNIIESHTTKVREFIKKFGESRDVKLTDSDGTGWDFMFSGDRIPEEKPQPGEIILSEDLSVNLRNALDHNVKNRFTSILPTASLLKNASEDPNVREKLQSITNVSERMLKEFSSAISAQEKHQQMRLFTDSQGKTTIFQIPVKYSPEEAHLSS